MSEHNEALRSHVTRVGFDLTLGKTHIASLVMLNESLRRRQHIDSRHASGGFARTFSWFVPGIRGCQDRGLVIHHHRPEWSNKPGNHLGKHYTITKAGKLVIDLLKEAGIYQEYAGSLPAVEAAAS